MGTTDQTPVERKAEARAVVVMASARRQTYGTVDDELRIALDEFEHACIAESVAPALEYIDEMVKLGHVSLSDSRKLRSLLTEGRE
jgi:hypothetical protein